MRKHGLALQSLREDILRSIAFHQSLFWKLKNRFKTCRWFPFFRNVLEGIVLDLHIFNWINLWRTASSMRFWWVEKWTSIYGNSILQITEIYCKGGEGSLLHTVQMTTPRLYKDSKTFVDKPLKTSPDDVLKNFNELMKVCINSI